MLKVKSLKVERFEDVIAWQKAKVLCVAVYRAFKEGKDYYGLKYQIQVASVSVMNNAVEGMSNKPDLLDLYEEL